MEEETVLSEDEKLAKEAAEAEAKAAEEKTVYQTELEKLQTEKDEAEAAKGKAEEEARQKTGALAEEREKRKAADAAAKALAKSKEVSDEELDKRLDEKLAARLDGKEFNQLLTQVTADPDEIALIKHHYETSIVKTGNVAEDLKKATAIANQHLVEQAKAAQIEREAVEGRTTSFLGSKTFSKQGKPAYETDPRLKQAAAILDKLGAGDAKKFLS